MRPAKIKARNRIKGRTTTPRWKKNKKARGVGVPR